MDRSQDSSEEEDEGQSSETSEEVMKARASFKAPAEWMIVFGAILALCAGILNVGAVVELRTVVSHMTGLTTALGLRASRLMTDDVTDGHADAAREAGFIILSFVFGSFLCGLIIPKNALQFGGKSFYGVALLGTSAFCILCTFCSLEGWRLAAACSAAVGSGLQNAVCSLHLGAVVRTTHVTGTVTDIGSTSGRALMILLRGALGRRKLTPLDRAELEVDVKKLRVLMALYIFFGIGCYLGTQLHRQLGPWIFLVPAGATGAMGITYAFFREPLKRHIKRRQLRKLKVELDDVTDIIQRARTRKLDGTQSHSTVGEEKDEVDNADVDREVDHAIEVLHELQETIQQLYADRVSDSEEGPAEFHASRVQGHRMSGHWG